MVSRTVPFQEVLVRRMGSVCLGGILVLTGTVVGILVFFLPGPGITLVALGLGLILGKARTERVMARLRLLGKSLPGTGSRQVHRK